MSRVSPEEKHTFSPPAVSCHLPEVGGDGFISHYTHNLLIQRDKLYANDLKQVCVLGVPSLLQRGSCQRTHDRSPSPSSGNPVQHSAPAPVPYWPVGNNTQHTRVYTCYPAHTHRHEQFGKLNYSIILYVFHSMIHWLN